MFNRNSHRLILIIVLLFAGLTRLQGVSWGLSYFDPYVNNAFYHPDEYKIILVAKNLQKQPIIGDLRYPTAMHYTLGLITLPIRNNKTKLPENLYDASFFIIGRLISIVYGTLAVLMTYFLGKKVHDQLTGLISAGLLAISIYHVRNSSLATTDVATSFWLVVCILISLKTTANSKVWRYIILGISFGMLIGTKYTGGFAIIPIAFHFIQIRQSEESTRTRFILSLAITCVVSLVVFLVTTPSILFLPSSFLKSLAYEGHRLSLLKSPLWQSSTWVYFFSSLTEASNAFIVIIFCISTLFVIINKQKVLLSFVLTILCFYFYFNTSLAIRYWILLLPIVVVVAGWGISRALEFHNALFKIVVTIFLLITISYGIYQNIELYHLLHSDTRSQAAKYIQNLPRDSTFAKGFDSSTDLNNGWIFPFIAQKSVKIADKPDYIILSSFNNDLPKNSIIDLDIDESVNQYLMIKEFKPENNLKIEFLSPTIIVYQLNS